MMNMKDSIQHATSLTTAVLTATRAVNTGLYDLWLNSMPSVVDPSMVTRATPSSSHQISSIEINSQRLAEKLLQLSCMERAEERL